MRRLVLACACVLVAAPISDAQAQAQGDAKKEAKERKAEMRDGGAPAPAIAGDAAAPPRDLPTPSDPKKDRAKRRQQAISYNRARWGALLRQPAAQAELRLHARRVARIDAMEAVARSSGKDALLPRIAKLREKETARFEERMRWIQDGKEGGP